MLTGPGSDVSQGHPTCWCNPGHSSATFARPRQHHRRLRAQATRSCSQQFAEHTDAARLDLCSRRALLPAVTLGSALTVLPPSAQASKLPGIFDRAWEAVGGGPADLYFPSVFSGRWLVDAVLTKVEMPLGEKFIPDPATVARAVREDLDNHVQYEVSFMHNQRGNIITDRRFNTASLMAVYLGKDAVAAKNIEWNPDDPNVLSLYLPGGTGVRTRVTRRSQEENEREERINTSEYFEQIFDLPDKDQPKVKASQCFTKYRWRTTEEAARDNGPEIVATQVVSDFLTPYDGEMLMMQAKDKPVVKYTYRMTFRRPSVDYQTV